MISLTLKLKEELNLQETSLAPSGQVNRLMKVDISFWVSAWHACYSSTHLCIIFLKVALNTLFLKFSMWIPSTNPLILCSLIFWLLIARAEALESDYVFDKSSGYYYSSRLSRWQRLPEKKK
ncbi:hypothetical protein Bca101_061904 [Brassica carinata]